MLNRERATKRLIALREKERELFKNFFLATVDMRSRAYRAGGESEAQVEAIDEAAAVMVSASGLQYRMQQIPVDCLEKILAALERMALNVKPVKGSPQNTVAAKYFVAEHRYLKALIAYQNFRKSIKFKKSEEE